MGVLVTPAGRVRGDGPVSPPPAALTLETVERVAVQRSPAIAGLEARVRAARWQCLQEGLPPNPSAGYLAAEVGNEGAAGQQGAYVSQTFIRGGKLGYAQAVASKESKRLEQALAAERMRVLTDTRTAFYEVFLTQLAVDLAGRLTETSERAAAASVELVEAGEGRVTDRLQAEIETRRAAASQQRARARNDAAWRRLATLTGIRSMYPMPVTADRSELIEQLDWRGTLDSVLQTSPEVAERIAAVEKARCELVYQRSVATPDVTAQLSVQYDDATGYTVAGVQVGAPLLLWNRNQGAIGRAHAELTAAQRRLDLTEQTLGRRLAEAYGRYEAARIQAEMLENEVLPRAEESLSIATRGYEAGEIGFLDLLTVQRTYFQANLEALSSLGELNKTLQLIRGCLLSDVGSSPELN